MIRKQINKLNFKGMIKISKYAFVGAAMLTGSMAFTACSSDSDATDNGSAVNPTGETVKTQFAINVPKAGSTRMAENIVQEGTYTFRGITDIRLMPLTLTKENPNVTNETSLTKIIPLGNFGADVYDKGNTEYKLYSDVEIPVGTNHFLFYGVAGSESSAKKADIGSLETTLVDKNDDNKVNSSVATAGVITFKLENIASESTATNLKETKDKLVGLLNDIASAKISDDNKWSGVAEDDEYGKLYNKFKRLTSGSAHTILLTVQSLYNHVESSTEGMGKAIKDVIESKFTVKDDKSVEYKSDSNIDAAFPENLGLPQGALMLQFNNKFSYVENNEGVITNPSLDINNLTYPASLYYFDNTALKATNKTTVDWPKTAAEWAKPGNWDDWNDAVAATSRTIALKDNINYGVAMLVLTVKTGSKNLADNANANGLTGGNKIVVPTKGFPVTGVLVGGQPTQSNWEFLPTTDATKTYTVYDHSINGNNVAATPNSATGTNYTLLLDNRKCDTDGKVSTAQDEVNIAVEFTNNSGVAFYGQSGIIEPNQKFYLLAKLNPEAESAKKTEFNYEGTGLIKENGFIPVFVRDHKTVVNLTINKLSNAYNTIPDLRASNLKLGMSVDLKWEDGLTFDVALGD